MNTGLVGLCGRRISCSSEHRFYHGPQTVYIFLEQAARHARVRAMREQQGEGVAICSAKRTGPSPSPSPYFHPQNFNLIFFTRLVGLPVERRARGCGC